MNSDHLDRILDGATAQVRTVLGELHPHIQETAVAILEDTQDSPRQRRKAKVKVSLTVTLDLSHSPPAWQVNGAVGLRRRITGDKCTLEDETPELPGIAG